MRLKPRKIEQNRVISRPDRRLCWTASPGMRIDLKVTSYWWKTWKMLSSRKHFKKFLEYLTRVYCQVCHTVKCTVHCHCLQKNLWFFRKQYLILDIPYLVHIGFLLKSSLLNPNSSLLAIGWRYCLSRCVLANFWQLRMLSKQGCIAVKNLPEVVR